MQYVFLIRSRAGCKKYVTRRRWATYFLQPLQRELERIKNLFQFLLLIFNDILRKKTMGLSFIADVGL